VVVGKRDEREREKVGKGKGWREETQHSSDSEWYLYSTTFDLWERRRERQTDRTTKQTIREKRERESGRRRH